MSDNFRIDPHVKVLSDAIIKRAKRRGLDALVYAPHFTQLSTIQQTAAYYSDDTLRVLPGREIFTGPWHNRKHILAVAPDKPIPDFITLDAAMSELERQDTTVLVPHPMFTTVGLSGADCRRYRRQVDAVEVYNPKHLPVHNRRAQRLADLLHAPVFGSSYAHLPQTVGDVWTTIHDVATPQTPEEIITALSNSPRRVCRRVTAGARGRAIAEKAHLGWENSWKKLDRIVLSGREPTHPAQPVYNGRFDDAAVY